MWNEQDGTGHGNTIATRLGGDDARFRTHTGAGAERRGLHCSVFADGDAVLQAARTQSADFLVLDSSWASNPAWH